MAKKVVVKKTTVEDPIVPAAKGSAKFSTNVDVPDPTPEQAKARAIAQVVRDHNSRVALELRREGKDVIFIPIAESGQGYDVHRVSAELFDRRYKPLIEYPVGRAAKLFTGFILDHGGTDNVIAELEKLITITPKEKEMAQARSAGAQAKTATTKEKKPAKSKAPAGEKKPRGPSAASRFKELIMAGKQTDDEIFATVQKEFGLGDEKRSYVAWYRNWLVKNGENPPAAKGEKVAAAPAKKKTKAA